jgi:hypothetical protein
MQNKGLFFRYFLFAVILMSLTLGVLRIFQPLFWLVLFPDDSFYYLRIAQNVARGLGSSFDGINPTNGYHPLWMIMLLPVASFFKAPENLLRAVLVLQILLAGTGFGFLGLIFEKTGTKKSGLLLAGALVFLNPVLLSIFVNGLESALYFCALCLGFLLWVITLDKKPYEFLLWLGLGAFFGVVFLSRLDGAILAFWLGVAILINNEALTARIKKALGFGIGFIAVSVPYLAYNLARFGNLMPISGRVKSYYMSHNLKYLAALSLFFLVLIAAVVIYHFLQRQTQSSFAKTLLSFMEFGLCLIFYYMLSPAYAFTIWYYLPAILFGVLILGWILAALLENKSRAGKATVGAILALGAFGILLGFFLHLYTPANSVFKLQNEVTEWIKRNTPEDSLLAAWSSGGVAYFSGRQTVNLDGLVNSPDYFFNYRIKGKRDEFMKNLGVDYIVVYYDYDAPAPTASFSFPTTAVVQLKADYRGPGTFFRKSKISYFVLQTGFARHPRIRQ